MDEQELERLVRQTYGDMPVPPLRPRARVRRRIPLAAAAAVAAAIVIGIGVGTALPRLRAAPATGPATAPATGPYAVLFAEGSAERFLVVDVDGRTLASLDRGSTLSVSSVTPSPDGRLVAYWRTSVTDAQLLIWEISTGQIQAIYGSDELGGGVVWAPDSSSLVTWTGTRPVGPDIPPRSSRILRAQVDGVVTELLRVTDQLVPIPIAYDGRRVGAIRGVARGEAEYVVIRQKDEVLTTRIATRLPAAFPNPSSRDGVTAAGNFKEFESVDPTDIRVWSLDSFDPPLARLLERGAEGALLWPGKHAVVFAKFTGPETGILKALRFGGTQRVEELAATDGSPLAFDPSGNWLLTSGPSVHQIAGDTVGAPRRLAVPMPMRAIGWVSGGAVTRTAPPTPAPPSCDQPGTSAEDVLRAFFNEVRDGDVGGMVACWSPGRFAFGDASAYTRTRLLDLAIEPLGRDTEGLRLLAFRVRASWEFRERSPWRADGGCCERVFLVRQIDDTTWRIDSSQTVSAKLPPDACAARMGLPPEQVVELWFMLLADERAEDMAACWADTIPDRAALMRAYAATGGTARLEIGPATPTRSGGVAVQVVADWRTSGFGAWSNGETKWLIVRRQPDGRWAIESTATALVPEAQ